MRLILLSIGAYVFVHLFIEVQPRYIFYLVGPMCLLLPKLETLIKVITIKK